MAGKFCYLTTSIDRAVSNRLGLKPDVVRALRGAYDEWATANGKSTLKFSDDPTEEEKEDVVEKIRSFRAEIYKRHADRIRNMKKDVPEAWDVLRHELLMEHRVAGISVISRLFSEELDILDSETPTVNRAIIANGFVSGGNYCGGPAAIMAKVYDRILLDISDLELRIADPNAYFEKDMEDPKYGSVGESLYKATHTELFVAYEKTLQQRVQLLRTLVKCWEEFIPFVMKDLMRTEGIIIGSNSEYAAVASEFSYAENNIAEQWEISEARRDGWMDNSDMQSSFGSVVQQVRRAISTVPLLTEFPIWEENMTDNGTVYYTIKEHKVTVSYNDFGYPTFMDPVQVHHYLAKFLRGVQDSEDLMERMDECPFWMEPIKELLEKNERLKTQFVVDFHKAFQPYSVILDDEKDRKGFIHSIKTFILNQPKINAGRKAYERMLKGRSRKSLSKRAISNASVTSGDKNVSILVFDPDTKIIRWDRLASVHKQVRSWVEQPNAKTGCKLLSKDVEDSAKVNFLAGVFASLGINYSVPALHSIVQSDDLLKVKNRLDKLFDRNSNSGISYMIDTVTEDGTRAKYNTLKSLSGEYKEEKDKKKALPKQKEALDALKDQKVSFFSLYNATKKDNQPVAEHINSLIDIVIHHDVESNMEDKVRYQGKTLYSHVAPSYLSDKLDIIKNFVKNDDKTGLLDYLKANFLDCPYFVSDEFLLAAADGKNIGSKGIYNMWLAALVDACNNKDVKLVDSVAQIFTFERNLGTEEKEFENFTARDHCVDLFIHYFADENQGKSYDKNPEDEYDRKSSALYPMFTMGDANVSKYIRAPRITTAVPVDKKGNEVKQAEFRSGAFNKVDHVEYRFDDKAKEQILEQFYQVYLQERSRMAIDKALAIQWSGNGKNINWPEDKFSLLTFLNDEEFKIEEGREDDKDYVISKIRDYLDKASIGGSEEGKNNEYYEVTRNGQKVKVPTFQKRLEIAGALETSANKDGSNKKYVWLNNVATPKNIRDKVQDYFWNTTLATIQQLQIMTIDPYYYDGTKTLQKRYKETHAPGNVVDVKAKDRNGRLYCPERTITRWERNKKTGKLEANPKDERVAAGMETMIYFDDVKLNSERTSPEFMEAIFRINTPIGKEEEAEQLIEKGFLIPKDDNTQESARQKALRDFLGEAGYELYKTYTSNSLTDGQGYRTLESYRMVMGMAGKWEDSMEDAYNKIKTISARYAIVENGKIVGYNKFSNKDLREILHLSVVFQPIKPYLFTHEKVPCTKTIKDGDGNDRNINTNHLVPVQHKYAEAIIIPQLLPEGSMLRDMGIWMEANNVDLAGSTKIAKVGCFKQTNFNEVKDNDSLVGALRGAYIHVLDYKDWRIQTNVPEHINVSRLFGTQIRKLIMSSINPLSNYLHYLDTKEINLSTEPDGGGPNAHAQLTGKNILALYNSLIAANIMDSYDVFEEHATDIVRMAEMLQQSTISSMRESMDNLLGYVVMGDEEAFKEFLIPLFEGGLEHDTAALILSTFKKIVNKQQISGGSAVQVSALGINGYEESGGLKFVTDPDDKKNILYAEIEVPFDRSYTVERRLPDGTVQKETVYLDYSTYCYEDGNVKPSDEVIAKGTEEWKKYQSYTYKEVTVTLPSGKKQTRLVPCEADEEGAKVYKPLIEKHYPGILNIIAYRIPTERDYSILNCRIKRFSSKIAGGIIRVPLEGTSISGFDFDIDKLYFMMREYRTHINQNIYTEEHYGDADLSLIWGLVYDRYPLIKDALKREKEAYVAHRKYLIESGRKGEVKDRESYALNSFWDEAKITEKYGVDKSWVFAVAADEARTTLDIEPEVQEEIKEHSWIEKYDFSKTPDENTRVARNNLLIDLMEARLMDPETAGYRYTPGGFPSAKKSARFLRELKYGKLDDSVRTQSGELDLEALRQRQDDESDPEPDYSPTDPWTLVHYNQQNQLAAKLIGIFANHSTNQAYCSALDTLELKEDIDISFCGHKNYHDFLHHNDKETKRRVDLLMAEFLAASVDAVKDPVLGFLNLNLATADAGAMLARLGYTMEEIGLLFNQAAIVKVCEDANNRGVQVATAIEDEITRLKEKAKIVVPVTGDFSTKSLVNNIVAEREALEKGRTSAQYIEEHAVEQIAILELFGRILNVANDLSQLVRYTKFTAANAVGSTMGSLYEQQVKVKEFSDKVLGNTSTINISVAPEELKALGRPDVPIDSSEDLIEGDFSTKEGRREYKKKYLRMVRFNPFAYEQAMFDANRRALRALSKYYPYETKAYKDARSFIQSLAMYGVLSEDEINDIHIQIPVALLAKQMGSLFDGEHVYIDGNNERTNLTNREYYTTKFAEELEMLLEEDPKLARLSIFERVRPYSEEVITETVDALSRDKAKSETIWRLDLLNIVGADGTLKEQYKEDWAFLMDVDDEGRFKNPEYAKLGLDLFAYCFYQRGFNFSPYSFMHLAPTATKDYAEVTRTSSFSPKKHNHDIKISTNEKPSDDIFIGTTQEEAELAERCYNATVGVKEILTGQSYIMPELTQETVNKLMIMAKSRPDKRFKFNRPLTQEEHKFFWLANSKISMPSNIYFCSEESFSDEDYENIKVGISYREFLGEILTGKNLGFDEAEFARMFILNNLDNPKFVLDVERSSKRVKEIIEKQKQKNGGLYDLITTDEKDSQGRPIVITQYKDSIEIDVSPYDNEDDIKALSRIVKLEKDNNFQIKSAKWVPVIRIGDSYYMAESGSEDGKFNINASYKMRYYKVEPWGCKKTMRYDNFREKKPSMTYKSSINPVKTGLNPDYKWSKTSAPQAAPTTTSDLGDSTDIVTAIETIKDVVPTESLKNFPPDWKGITDSILKITDTKMSNIRSSVEDIIPDHIKDSLEKIKSWIPLLNVLCDSISDRNNAPITQDDGGDDSTAGHSPTAPESVTAMPDTWAQTAPIFDLRRALVSALLKEDVSKNGLDATDVDGMIEASGKRWGEVNSMTKDEIRNKVAEIRAKQKADGIPMMGEDGKMSKACGS